MLTDTDQAPDTAARLINAARSIATQLNDDRAVRRGLINEVMTAAFGAKSADGAWTQRDSFVMTEIAAIIAGRNARLPDQPTAIIDQLAKLEKAFPTQTVRSEEQIAHQHFSTPLDLAWLVNHLAIIGSEDMVLEPSAGIGMLAQWAGRGKMLQLNELDPVRAAVLRHLFPENSVTSFNAAQINQHISARPSVVIMNPPFARNAAGAEDPFAAHRHFVSALAALQHSGRIVAIMPDSFNPGGKHGSLFDRAISGATVRLMLRLDKGFAGKGTSVAVRIIVADKGPAGQRPPSTINRASVSELLEAIREVPQRAIVRPDPLPPTRPRTMKPGSLFGAFRTAPAKSFPRAERPLPSFEIATVDYRIHDPVAAAHDEAALYVPWRSQRLEFDKPSDHPSPLVESAAMAAVALPAPSYRPQLPKRVLDDKILSAAQLETIVHALAATEIDLPGRYRLPEKGLALIPHPEGQSYRQGFFLGDGTGAGKGRQLAGIAMDQWLRGKRRHLWLSDSSALIEDARRDWQALGGTPLDIQPLGRVRAGIEIGDSILFASYATLRSEARGDRRVDQILAWLTDEFDGLILFDEAHAMGGVAGGEGRFGATLGSQQGIAGVELQNRLPRARVIYASATGASDINNLAYATRLGLWGEGTAFVDREAFTARIRDGGVAAMELVAREMKAMGVYTARALSYAGVEYDILEHQLTTSQIADFDTYADAWAIIHRNMEEALAAAGVVDRLTGATLNGQALSAARSRFESAKQRFFSALLLAMKLPSLLPAIDDALRAEQSAVIQLVTTSEALLSRRLADLDPADRAELALDLSPRELVMDYLEAAFPTRAMEIVSDDEGNERSRPQSDADGNPVHSEEALQIRADTLELLGAMPPIAPALDAVIERFGTDAVAEVTGRTKRLVRLPDGGQKLQSRSPSACMADAEAFMNGAKRILVFSDAGGTGRSYHASLDHQNQQRRVHFLLEPGWRADRAVQGLGRTNRTNQAQPPIFRPVTTDCRGERRFISTIARRLDALGALTRGQRQTGGQNLFDPMDNLESHYAKDALLTWYRLLHHGKLTSVRFEDFCHRTGLRLEYEGELVEKLPPIQRWLNRILALPIAIQNAIFDEYLGLVETRIDAAKKAGTFDSGVETIRADKLTIVDEIILRPGADTSTSTRLLTVEAGWQREIKSLADVSELADRFGHRATRLRNARSGKVALQTPARTRLTDTGEAVATWQLHRPGHHQYITAGDLEESMWEPVDAATFRHCWTDECEDLSQNPNRERFFLATGRLLPIWNLLGDDPAVRRLVTADGRALLGRIVPHGDVNALLGKLGISGAINLAPAEIVAAVWEGKLVAIGGNTGLTLQRRRVNGEARLELTGFDPRSLPGLKAKGCFTEIIQFRTRVFIPVSRAEEVLAEIARDVP
ncbi:strawberry notch-like NTP hydrolase domain-containing protein [Sphingopyxis sp. R3-92]|uniref:strawberry notch-like NTP hydrolase domain-containing protein n=1 Tax=Sphingopyxis sp. R3-92 TaxID=3158553 RepID=UPI003EE6F3F4